MAVRYEVQDITTTTQSKQTQKTGAKIKNVSMTKTGNKFTVVYSIDRGKLICKQIPKELEEDLQNYNVS
eukprot:10606186-Ditylum_brightwellii.AAC.1